jgi:uncharacterized protein with HEPN domain
LSTKDPVRLLEDVIESIDHIHAFTAGIDEAQYEVDTKTQWAVERALLIIAEVGYRLKDSIDLLCPGPPWQGIRGLGNLIRHGYEAVANRRVWETVQKDLPNLRAAVVAALERLRA